MNDCFANICLLLEILQIFFITINGNYGGLRIFPVSNNFRITFRAY